MLWSWKRSAGLGVALLLSVAFSGCAPEVGDIDRTQPNKLKKSDLDGTWYMFQKIVDIPSTAGMNTGFEGLMSDADKVVFVAEEKYLMAYRSYPHLAGSDITGVNMTGEDSYEEFYGDDYKGSVLAMYPIESHFDVQRTYDSSTGEQSNVIVENSSDRPWYEREYMRVNWTANPIVNIEWSVFYDMNFSLGYQETAEVDPKRAPYFEYDEHGKLQYFDAPGNYIVESDMWQCLYAKFLAWGYSDCSGSEVRVVTSFTRDNGDHDYEPLVYDDTMMNRFGFFRVERYTYDERHDLTQSGRILLANRHNIWKSSYKKDSLGNFVLDADGNKEPIPIEDREVRTTGYYVRNLPMNDPHMVKAADYLVESWNTIFKNAVATVQNKPLSAVDDVFVICHIPVLESDNTEVCGPVGFEPREGDIRRNVMWVVDQRQDVGLLGYGPSVVDPLTGETLSGHAHVYLSAVGTYAQSLLDQIKFTNGDLTVDGVISADDRKASASKNGAQLLEIARISDQLKTKGLKEWKNDPRTQKRLAKREVLRSELRESDPAAIDARLKKAYDAGLLNVADSVATQRLSAQRLGLDPDNLTDEQIEMLSPYQMMSLRNRVSRKAVERDLLKRKMTLSNMPNDLALGGISHKYAGRTDYDEIWRELRAANFISTTIHEMGHTFGLRHNFSGSYDSLNYFDEFWKLRLNDGGVFTKKKTTLEDMYALYDRTQEQLDGGMGEYQYSSIMDYSAGPSSDLKGLGKYDQAAITFAYTGGTTRVAVPANRTCESIGGKVYGGQCLAMRPGYVEIFNKRLNQLGRAGALLNYRDTTGTSTYDDLTAVGQPYLEMTHFSTFMNNFEDINDAWDRSWVRLDEYLASKASEGENRMVRVPYVFCTDDNEGQLHSCRAFDGGADMMEQMLRQIDNYRRYYAFTEFARDRAFWSPDWPMGRHDRTFSYVSDTFQHWYVSNSIENYTDDLNDTLRYNAILAGFNFLAEVIATPEYGAFCQNTSNGHLIALNNDDEASAEENSEYYLDAHCRGGAKTDLDAKLFYVKQGEGRRRYMKYDADMGFNYGAYPKENGHVYTSWLALIYLFDNYADVIAPGGDIGTYLISMINYFDAEIIDLANSMLDQTYEHHSPRLVFNDRDGNPITENYGGVEYRSGRLVYPVLASAYADEGFDYNPETGESIADITANTGFLPFGSKCLSDATCVGTGVEGVEAYCGVAIGLGEADRCIVEIARNAEAKCPEGADTYTYSDGTTICHVEANSAAEIDAKFEALAQTKCSATNWFGSCADATEACVAGTCKEFYPIVDTDTSISQVMYLTLFGMLYVSEGMTVKFSDQMQIYKLGSGETTDPGDGYTRVTFTDPFIGTTYAANKLDCTVNPLPIACKGNVNSFTSTGSVRLVEQGNRLLADYQQKYDEFFSWYRNNSGDIDFDDPSSALYKKYLKLMRRWRNAEYELQDHIDVINYVRSMYNLFAAPY